MKPTLKFSPPPLLSSQLQVLLEAQESFDGSVMTRSNSHISPVQGNPQGHQGLEPETWKMSDMKQSDNLQIDKPFSTFHNIYMWASFCNGGPTEGFIFLNEQYLPTFKGWIKIVAH